MTDIGLTQPRWVKSTYSDDGGNCVELDMANYGTVRDSKDPNGPHLHFTAEALTTFVTAIADGGLA